MGGKQSRTVRVEEEDGVVLDGRKQTERERECPDNQKEICDTQIFCYILLGPTIDIYRYIDTAKSSVIILSNPTRYCILKMYRYQK